MDTPRQENVSLRTVLSLLESIDARLSYVVERQRKTEELFLEMTPILREVMATATSKLDALEKKRYFAFGRELVGVVERIAEGFAPEDVRQLGDAIVSILNTVRATTQPRVLQVARDASLVIDRADEAAPIGLVGVMRATRDDDVQKGLAVMMELMRGVGRAARAAEAPPPAEDSETRKARLALALGPRRRPPAPQPKAANGVCARPAAPPVEIEAGPWSDELAAKLAAAEGLSLDDARWAVVRFARADFQKTGVSPNIRRITQETKIPTKDLYGLFPKAPARTVAKIAGIPKPAGCI